MASWIRRDESHEDGNQAARNKFDGYQIDRPEGIDPLDDMNYARLRVFLWLDLESVGCSQRWIARLFGVSKDRVRRALDDVPEQVKKDRLPADRYFDRLKAVVAKDPKDVEEFGRMMMAEAGTLDLQKVAFSNAGLHRKSIGTVLGKPRKSQAKSRPR